MPLRRGSRLGPYEVLAPLGAGGMGEVYRARDTRLDRDVAVKVLPADLTSDPGRRARLEREAKTIASLNDPRICTLFDVGHERGTDYLVMELVEGETLAERLRKGALPLAQTLRTGIEIAGALDKAHRQGVIHRDLKPGNVMLTKAGSKLMDFGLAKPALGGAAGGDSAMITASAPLTGQGTMLGTVAYMAPELLGGNEADARSDLWALGCVLYEMATGKHVFEGRTQASLIAAIMNDEPQPLTQLQPVTPLSLERLVKVCLAKDPDERLQTAHDVMQQLKWIGEDSSGAVAVGGVAPRTAAPKWRRWAVVGAALLLAGVLGGVAWWRLAPAPARAPVVRSLLNVAPAESLSSKELNRRVRPAFTFTPDGQSLVFVGMRGGVLRLYVRALDGEEARVLEGTEDADAPAVSADGQWVAFCSKGAIRRIPIVGGPTSTLVDSVSPGSSMAWGRDGRLFYSDATLIYSVTPEHPPTTVTKHVPRGGIERSDEEHLFPHLLPDGRALLYTVIRGAGKPGDVETVAHVFATGEIKLLLKDAIDARYVASGHLVFMRRNTLMAVDFDLARLKVLGTPIPVLGDVAQLLNFADQEVQTGAGQFSVSSTGTLAWLQSTIKADSGIRMAPVAIDRQGRARPLDAPSSEYGGYVAVSPDGRQLALNYRDGLWVRDLARGTLTNLPGGGGMPRWTPDGQRISSLATIDGIDQLVWQRADGTGAVKVLAREPGLPSSWSPDGRQLALCRPLNPNRFKDFRTWIATIAGDTVTLKPTQEEEAWPEFSPDGRWLAYGTAGASGHAEVYVRPYPGPGPRQQVSLNGGGMPAWSSSGRELFFVTAPDTGRGIFHADGQMMAVDVRTGPTLELGRPHPLFTYSPEVTGLGGFPVRPYAVAPDGQFFYAMRVAPRSPRAPITQIRLVTNWLDELKTRVAAGQAK